MINSTIKNAATLGLCLFLSMALVACAQNGKSNINQPYNYIGSSDDSTDGGDMAVTPDAMQDLEQRVEILERDFREMKPGIENLLAIESDIQNLIAELSQLTDRTTTTVPDTMPSSPQTSAPSAQQQAALQTPPQIKTPSSDAAPTDLTAAPETQQKAPEKQAPKETPKAIASAKNTVKDVRFGTYQGATRVVFDFTAGTDVDYDIRKENGNIVIDFKNIGWDAPTEWNSSKYKLIGGYSATAGDTSQVVLKTNGQDMTVKVFKLPPVNASSGPRLVLDFAPGVS